MITLHRTILIITAITITLPAHADWGDLLGDWGKKAQSVLSSDTTESDPEQSSLSESTVVSGLKEALTVGTKRAISLISQENGFLDNADIRIPMPPALDTAANLMKKYGLAELADQFETSINRAAEDAAPAATNIVVKAIENITIQDALTILNGADNAATEYFRKHTSADLTALFQPKVEKSLNEVGSTRYYNQLNEQVSSIPFVGEQLNVDLPDYVTTHALDGLFTMLAAEEKKIRDNPTARTTELLKQVFTQ